MLPKPFRSLMIFWFFGLVLAAELTLEKLESAVVADTLNVTGADVFKSNQAISPYIRQVSQQPYFSTYKVDMSDDLCPFVDNTGTCGNRACAIEPLDEDVPCELQSRYLGRLKKDSTSDMAPGCVKEDLYVNSNLDYCYPEDEAADGIWVDLNANPERFTGYGGAHAHKVWRAVYQENCFGYSGEESQSTLRPVNDLADIFDDRHARQEVGGEVGELALNIGQCVEQRLFYRLLSGMHSSISTHLSYDHLNQSTARWGPNLQEFMTRVGHYPERINNLLFNHVLISRAIIKLQTYLQLLSFSSTCPSVDSEIRFELHRLGHYLGREGQGLNETELFSTPEAYALKDEFRKRVRNVNALMSCTGCERCRLWGKIQTVGYGTALKLLFELPEDPDSDPQAVTTVLTHLKRSEVVALVQTFARLSHSVDALQYFTRKYEDSKINKRSFSYQWSFHMKETKRALWFILKSYIDFPKNLWRLFLFYASVYWNRFVGKQLTYIMLDTLQQQEL